MLFSGSNFPLVIPCGKSIVSDTMAIRNVARPAKWNWPLIEALYFAGMGCAQIIRQPEFAGMTLAYLAKESTRRGWPAERENAKNFMLKRALPRDTAAKLEEARNRHVNTMIEVLEKERAVIAQKVVSPFNQKERLEILDKYDGIARRTLELDKEENNPAKKSLTFMLVLGQQAQAQIRGLRGDSSPSDGVPATYTLNGNKNATTGILSARNGHTEGEDEPITAQNGQNGEVEGQAGSHGIGMDNLREATPDDILAEYRGSMPGGMKFVPPLEIEGEDGDGEGE